MTCPTPADVVALASRAAFDKKLVTNVHRAMLVEAMVSVVLAPDWSWCASDYFPYDFRYVGSSSKETTRLEVKQSAARQSWVSPKPSAIRWDIAERDGYWDGNVWIEKKARYADIYILAHHPGWDDATDHRDPDQWRFFVIGTNSLPTTQTISLAKADSKVHAVGIAALRQVVEATRATMVCCSVP